MTAPESPRSPARWLMLLPLVAVVGLLIWRPWSDNATEAQAPIIRPTPTAAAAAAPEPTAEEAATPTAPDDPQEAAPTESAEEPSAPADPTPTATALPSPTPEPFVPDTVVWSGCGNVQCATVAVPLDYDDPQGPTIELAITLHRATGDRLGVLLVNPGGPGAGGISYAATVARLDPALASRFDIVGWDPRGVGQSTPLSCGGELLDFYALDSDPDNQAETDELEAAAQAVANRCDELDGDLLPHIGTDSVIDDLEMIRQALGEDKLNFMGLSYGTLIGAEYADRYGQNVRAMVLDGVVNPNQTLAEWLTGQAVQAEKSLDELFARCSSICSAGDPAVAFQDLLAAAEVGEVSDGRGGVLTATQVIEATIIVTYRPNSEAALLTAIMNRDGATLANLSDSYQNFGGWNVYTAVSCVDSPVPSTAADFADFAADAEQQAPRFGSDVANELLPCAFWPAESSRQPREIAAPDAPPILVVGNTGDTATPYVNAVELARTLQQGALLTHEGSGHTSYLDNACVDDVIRNYLINLVVPDPGSTCL